MNILVIAAHPDDEVLGCGAAIIKHAKKGDKVYVCILTDGAKTRYPKKMANQLKKEALNCSKTLGASRVIFKSLPNQLLDTVAITKVIKTIEQIIEETKPEIVYTHAKNDLNRDHKVVYEATLVATRPIPGNNVKKVLSYFVPSSSEYNDSETENQFIPNVFLNIKNEIEDKIKAASYYGTEMRLYPHPRSKEAMRVYGKYWGIRAGIEYAEPFRLIREIEP